MKSAISIGLLGLLGLVGTLPASADPLFADEATLAVTLTAPFRSLARDKSEAPEERPGQLAFMVDGAPRSVAIELRPRGKSRRDRSVCTFPPIRLDLPKKQLDGTVFAKQDKLKLVTHCQAGRRGHPYLLREYLAYRILNLLTPNSFRVRMLDITYVDSERGDRPSQQPGFLIEHKDRLAKRLQRELVEVERVAPSQLEPAATTLGELYQFLISNTDFSFIRGPVDDDCCHNAVLFTGAAGTVLPVPYDFDASGIVDAPYAMAQTGLGQRTVRDRIFRGFCRPEPHLADAVARTQEQRAPIFELIDGMAGFDDRSRQRVRRFVEDFYAILDNPSRFEKSIGGACRPTQKPPRRPA